MPTDIARASGVDGEVVLRRRTDPAAEELIVNGAFAMDSADTTTERALAGFVTGGRVLVGGLGLGYTVAALCATDAKDIEVVELEPVLLAWATAGLTPTYALITADPRVRLRVADVADVLTAPGGAWDAILLDVDNGPDFLIHQHNAALYADEMLRAAMGRLSPGGVLAIWCQGPSPALLERLSTLPGTTTEHRYHVRRGERELTYAIYACTAR